MPKTRHHKTNEPEKKYIYFLFFFASIFVTRSHSAAAARTTGRMMNDKMAKMKYFDFSSIRGTPRNVLRWRMTMEVLDETNINQFSLRRKKLEKNANERMKRNEKRDNATFMRQILFVWDKLFAVSISSISCFF